MATTGTPASRKMQCSQRRGLNGAVACQRIVDVGEHAAHEHPTVCGRRSSGSGRDAIHGRGVLHKPCHRQAGAGLATIHRSFEERCKAVQVPGSKLFIATALTRTKAPWVSPAPPACLVRVLRDSGARP